MSKATGYVKIKYALVCFALVLTCLCGAFELHPQASTTVYGEEQKLSDLKNELGNLRTNKNTLLTELEQSKSELNSVMARKREIDIKVTYTEEEITLIKQLVEQYGEVVKSAEASIAQEEEKLDTAVKDYGVIVRYLYENGNVSFMELMLSADGLDEFFTKYNYIENILEYNDKLADEIIKTRRQLSEKRDAYNESLSSLEEYTVELAAREDEYAVMLTELETVSAELEAGITLTEEQISKLKAEESAFLSDIAAVQKQIEEKKAYFDGVFSWPFASNIRYTVTSRYGYRTDSPFSSGEHHNGIDIAVSSGTAIRAVAGGTVTRSEYYGNFGNVIVVDHGGGISSLYCHCSSRLVNVGATVLKDQVIARVGSTGQSSGPHLHFAVIKNGAYTNPASYLPSGCL